MSVLNTSYDRTGWSNGNWYYLKEIYKQLGWQIVLIEIRDEIVKLRCQLSKVVEQSLIKLIHWSLPQDSGSAYLLSQKGREFCCGWTKGVDIIPLTHIYWLFGFSVLVCYGLWFCSTDEQPDANFYPDLRLELGRSWAIFVDVLKLLSRREKEASKA